MRCDRCGEHAKRIWFVPEDGPFSGAPSYWLGECCIPEWSRGVAIDEEKCKAWWESERHVYSYKTDRAPYEYRVDHCTVPSLQGLIDHNVVNGWEVFYIKMTGNAPPLRVDVVLRRER